MQAIMRSKDRGKYAQLICEEINVVYLVVYFNIGEKYYEWRYKNKKYRHLAM